MKMNSITRFFILIKPLRDYVSCIFFREIIGFEIMLQICGILVKQCAQARLQLPLNGTFGNCSC